MLEQASLILFRRFQSSYAVFAGSDFDIEQALNEETPRVGNSDVNKEFSLQPFVAKQHYHKTGTLRWAQIIITSCASVTSALESITIKHDVSVLFLLFIGKIQPSKETIREEIDKLDETKLVFGLSEKSDILASLTTDLTALKRIYERDSRLQGDAVARKEVEQRISVTQQSLEIEKYKFIQKFNWFSEQAELGPLSSGQLNAVASELYGTLYSSSPIITNELLNRHKPGSSAKGGQNELLKRLINNVNEPNLGIGGYPVERGLFDSLYIKTGLAKSSSNGVKLNSPLDFTNDNYNLRELWRKTDEYLSTNQNRVVGLPEIFSFWRQAPIGLKNGLHVLLAFTYFLTSKDKVAIYRDGIFQANFSDADADLFGANQKGFGFRWMELETSSKEFLSELLEIIKSVAPTRSLDNLLPLDIAREVIAMYDNFHPTTGRTTSLPSETLKLRDILKNAHDPHDLLFGNLINFKTEHVSRAEYLKSLFEQLSSFFNTRLEEIKSLLFLELGVPNSSPQALNDLRARAENIKGIAPEYSIEGLVNRISQIRNTVEDIEAICGLSISKPTTMWYDQDFDAAKLSIQEFARKFILLETHASLKQRENLRSSFVILQADAGAKTIASTEFSVLKSQENEIEELATRIKDAMSKNSTSNRDVTLAALAKVSKVVAEETYFEDKNEQSTST